MLQRVYSSVALLLIVFVFACACAAGKDDLPSEYVISLDSNGQPITKEIKDSFIDIPIPTQQVNLGTIYSSIVPSTSNDGNTRTLTYSPYKMMFVEVTLNMYASFLNAPSAGSSITDDKDSFYNEEMQDKLVAGIYQVDPSSGVVVVTQISTDEANSNTDTSTPVFKAINPFATPGNLLRGKARQATKLVYQVAAGRQNYPVTFVNKLAAAEFAIWLGYQFRLPTEDEWEYAAAGGTQADFAVPWNGEQDPADPFSPIVAPSGVSEVDFRHILHYYANFQGLFPYPNYTTKVGQYDPNGFGLYDMTGNVYEWTLLSASDTGGTSSYLKGGSWNSKLLQHVGIWHRVQASSSFEADDLGFRVVFVENNLESVDPY